MLLQLADQAEIVIVISAADIEKNKVRSDLGITYDVDVLRLIQSFTDKGLYVGSVVITHYSGQNTADVIQTRSSNPWASRFTATTPSTVIRAMFR